MSYPFRDRSRLSDRYRGKTADELLNELKSEIDQDMFFDTPFPRSTGFPFDDMSRGRQDIRSHLEDLAQRHPEFADQLRCPPWGGEMGGPSHGTTWRSSRQGSAGDEPMFTQSKEPEQTEEPGPLRGRSRQNNLPTHGLRNTVDMGQQQHEAEQDQTSRGQRSMSAPPSDNRASDQPQRFVSRIDINPMNPGTGEGKPPAAPKQPSQQLPSSQKPAAKPPHQGASNVRHIPIFVEGRDEPVVPKNADSAPDRIFAERVIPTQTAPPQPPFPERVIPTQAGFPSERARRSQSPFAERTIPTQTASSPHSSFGFNRPSHFTSQPQFEPQRKCSKPQQPTHEQPTPQPPQPQAATPPPQRKAPEPKDPLSLVQAVQKDVDELATKVEAYSGTSRKDKDYIYLDEMLTRNLLKLDNIETEGKENVRQARKAVIRNIQKCISNLESKVPLPEESMEVTEGTETVPTTEEVIESTQNEEQPPRNDEQRSQNPEQTPSEVSNKGEIEQTETTEVPEKNIKQDVESMNADVTEASEQVNIKEPNVPSVEEALPANKEEEIAMNVEPPPESENSEKIVEKVPEPADTSALSRVEMSEAHSQDSNLVSQEQVGSQEIPDEVNKAEPKTDITTEAKSGIIGESVTTDLPMEVDITVPSSEEVKSDTVPASDNTECSGDKILVATDSPSKGKKGGKKGTAKSKKSPSRPST